VDARHGDGPPAYMALDKRPSDMTGQPVPSELELILLTCLAKDPADRPPTAAVLAQQLEAIRLEPWTEDQAQRWWAAN
jgi:hypothetical protein